MRFLILLILLAFPVSAVAEYTATRILVIPWGEGPAELKIALPHGFDDNGTPYDYTDDTYEILGGGPSYGFVDRLESVYISSYEFYYLKAFDSTGRLILDFSSAHPQYDSIIEHYAMGYFYVDTLSHIYILCSPRRDHIPVIDSLGNIISKLNPLGVGSGVNISRLFPNSSDQITVFCRNENYYTYANDSFVPGGSFAWRALDDNYYTAARSGSSDITFTTFTDSDIEGSKSGLSVTTVPIGETILNARLLGVDDDMNLYVFITENLSDTRVQVYDTSYQLQDQMILAPRSNKYHWHVWPFMRADGTLYEFRCLDDGLHVIRWSEE